MKTINRTAITIIPKQPYVDWADSFNDVKIYYKKVVKTILIPANTMNSMMKRT